ncbi:hypothetical protein PCCS19_30300 [Paenibacillus sp. CCS19]|uniref:response regulator n=1 Tax=Paenibacillus sp. CCS19 TaxID=3158387 RepID=UPI002561FB4F|nr:response regulator [Paenibacillus cellulosilyticus]GMK39975.1 hypothetical protein PCCS19_30300 [Paenibacillus cellulosilyticus]
MIDILLVDDESYVTESLARTIPWHDLGVTNVYQAESAKEALELLEEQEIDIVVSDIRMPGMDGLELIAVIGERWPNVRCMLLTGHSDFDYAKRALQLKAADYILKPVNDDEFVVSISNAVEKLHEEWKEADKYNQLMYDRKSDYTVLRNHLLHDLLLGRQLNGALVQNKLQQYEISLSVDEPAVLMLIQFSSPFDDSDAQSASLMEYAVGNIAEEIFGGSFRVWCGKTPHDCLVLLAQMKDSGRKRYSTVEQPGPAVREQLSEAAVRFQEQTSKFLRSETSCFITGWFPFPEGVADGYRSALSAFFLNEQGTEPSQSIQFLEEMVDRSLPAKSLEQLHKPPTLLHLLESKQWSAARDKIHEVFDLLGRTTRAREHLYEVFLYVSNAFMYSAHKRGQFMTDIDHSAFDMLLDRSGIHSQDKLRGWAVSMLGKLESELSSTESSTRTHLVKQVQEIVEQTLGQDTSVKTIADKVYLHPVYLSKIYKADTGESLSDYIIRMRMERAHYMLKKTNKKIYEITAELGYQNPQYFSKMFKKYYGMTPQEFRDTAD